MSDSQQQPPRVDAALADYFKRLDAGERIDQEEFIAAHEDIADALREYFQTAEQVEQLGQSDSQSTIGTELTTGITQPSARTTLRYFGDYELLEEIARGGMGVVYKARQVKLNRIVAVKMILAGQLADEQDVQRFYAEAEATAKLEHPHIVPIYEIGEHEGQHYFSMGFVEGVSLSELITQGPLEPLHAASIVEQVARAVQFAHDRGVIHRDLKPSNILVDDQDEAHVTDFGLAKRMGSDSALTQTGDVIGTPSYMPPEQAAGRAEIIGPTADVYSLGAILYTLLTGRPPFQSANVMDTLRQVVEHEPISPRQLNPIVSRDLETISLKCLEKSVSRRYATAAQLANELERLHNGQPIQARPVSRLTRFGKACRRFPVVSGLTAACIVAVIAGLVGFAWEWRRAEKAAALAKTEAEAKSRALHAETQARNKAVAEENRAKAAELDARHSLYIAHINMAQTAVKNKEIATAIELLNKQLPENIGGLDLRGFEWHYLWRKCHTALLTLEVGATDVAFHPDGRSIATVSGGQVATWDARTGEKLRIFEPPQLHEALRASANCIAFTSNGKRLFAGLAIAARSQPSEAKSGMVAVWDLNNDAAVSVFSGHLEPVTSLSISRGGDVVATSSGHSVAVFNSRSGDRSWIPMAMEIEESRDRLAPASPPLRTRPKRTRPHDVRVSISPDGTLLATSARSYPQVRLLGDGVNLWELRPRRQNLSPSWRHTHRLGIGGNAPILSGPVGQHLVTGGDRLVLWNTSSGKRVTQLSDGNGKINCLAFSPDGLTLAYSNDEGRSIKVLEADSKGHPSYELHGHRSAIQSLTFSPNGRRIASASAHETKIWHARALEKRQTRFELPPSDRSKSFRTDTQGNYVATISEDRSSRSQTTENPADSPVTIKIWDQRFRRARLVSTNTSVVGKVHDLVISDEGGHYAVATKDKVTVHRVSDGTKLFEEAPHNVSAMAVSPDGHLISYSTNADNASANADNAVEIWDVSRGERVARLDRSGQPLAFSHNSQDLAIALNEQIQFLRLRDQEEVGRIHLEPRHRSTSNLAFSPDNKRVAFVSSEVQFGKRIQIHDIRTGELLQELGGHSSSPTHLAWSPDGARLVSFASQPVTEVKVWSVRNGEQLVSLPTLISFSPHSKLSFNSSGNELRLSGGNSGGLWIGSALDSQQTIDREANAQVEWFRGRGYLKNEILDLLHSDETIAVEVRAKAVELAESLEISANDSYFISSNRTSALWPGQRLETYYRIVDAMTSSDGGPKKLTTLGIAQYRSCDYEGAVATLTESQRQYDEQVDYDMEAAYLNTLFLAMAELQFGLVRRAHSTYHRATRMEQIWKTTVHKVIMQEAEDMFRVITR